MNKKNKKGLEIMEIVIAIAILGTVAISVSGIIANSLKKNGTTIVQQVDKNFTPVNVTIK